MSAVSFALHLTFSLRICSLLLVWCIVSMECIFFPLPQKFCIFVIMTLYHSSVSWFFICSIMALFYNFLWASIPINNYFIQLVFSSSFNKSFQIRPFHRSLSNPWMKYPLEVCPLKSSQSYSEGELGLKTVWKRLGNWKSPWMACLIVKI